MEFGFTTAAYVVAAVLFILSLGGLSGQESAKRAVWYGIAADAVNRAQAFVRGATRRYTCQSRITGPKRRLASSRRWKRCEPRAKQAAASRITRTGVSCLRGVIGGSFR